jgi:hypothetical protein
VTVTVLPVNEVIAKDDTFSASTGIAIFFGSRGVLANDIDPENNAITKATVLAGAINGTVVLNTDGSFTYTSNPGFLGIDSFTYKAFDALGASDVGAVTINVIDAPPDGKQDKLKIAFDTPTFIDVLNNDSDPEGGSLEIIAVTQPANGKVTFTATGVTYEPNPGFTGTDRFTYTVSDGPGGINAAAAVVVDAEVSVQGKGVFFTNDDFFSRPEDTIVTLTEADLVSNDADTPTPLDIASVGDSIGGTVVLNADDSVTFTPTLDFVGQASFRYRLAVPFNTQDGLVLIDFTPAPDAPVSIDDAVAVTDVGSTKEVSVLVNDTDADGDFLTVSEVGQPQRGSAAIGLFGFDVVYTPPPEFVGSDTFTYTVSDGNGGTDTATVTILVGAGVVGTAGDDVFLVRVNPLGTAIEVFANAAGTGSPVLTALVGSLTSLLIDTLEGNDSLIVNGGNGTLLPAVQYQSGTGANTLNLQSGSVRIDASVDTGGTLDAVVQTGAELITDRIRQNSLTLAPGGRATVLPNGTLDAVSRLNVLTIGTGATLDINDNALVLDYTGASPEAAIRAEIVEGRGGAGIGNGLWNGTGISSTAAAAANALDPESRSIGYTDNGTLPLGPYAVFRGQPVDATSILIAFTRTGDTNLDSLVDDLDATILGAFYPAADARWSSGDFEYSGAVDDGDATLLGAFYNPTATPFPEAAPSLALKAAIEAQARDAIFTAIGGGAPLPLRRRR